MFQSVSFLTLLILTVIRLELQKMMFESKINRNDQLVFSLSAFGVSSQTEQISFLITGKLFRNITAKASAIPSASSSASFHDVYHIHTLCIDQRIKNLHCECFNCEYLTHLLFYCEHNKLNIDLMKSFEPRLILK